MDAFREQDEIGWWNFLLGCVTPKFAEVQQAYYMSIGSKRTGKVWLRRLVTQIWEVHWQMWEHRNYVLHETLTPHKQQELESLHDEIRSEFSQGTQGLSVVDHTRLEDKELVLNLGLSNSKCWLKNIQLARSSHARMKLTAAQKLAKQQHMMRQFFVIQSISGGEM